MRRMDIDRRFCGLMLVAALLPDLLPAHHRLSRPECDRLNERMRKLQSRLRQSHTARQGRAYRRRIRELQLERFRKC